MILPSEIYTIAKGETVIANILAQLNFIYPSLLFLRTYKVMANYVQDTIKRLLEKDFVSNELGEYSVYYQFFEI